MVVADTKSQSFYKGESPIRCYPKRASFFSAPNLTIYFRDNRILQLGQP